MKPLVIVHANCMDGLGAAYAAQCFLEDPEIVLANYGEAPPDVSGRNVYVFDFSYPREVLEDMYQKAEDLIVLDHHDSAEKALEGLPYAIFDQTKSGAVLAWEYLERRYGNRGEDFQYTVPRVLLYIQDRDLWQWKLEHSRAFSEYLRDTINLKDPLFNNLSILGQFVEADDEEFYEFVAHGEVLVEQKDRLIDEVVANYFIVTVPLATGEVEVAAAFCPARVYSEVGQRLAALSPCHAGVAIGNLSRDKFAMSFRGCDDSGMAQQLALHFGGGGHLKAAGAGLTPPELSALLNTARSPIKPQ